MLYNRIVVPKALWQEVHLQSLHAAHQGITAISDHGRDIVYWPGITGNIESIQTSGFECKCIITAKVPPHISTIPFKAVACDYLFYKG